MLHCSIVAVVFWLNDVISPSILSIKLFSFRDRFADSIIANLFTVGMNNFNAYITTVKEQARLDVGVIVHKL